MKSKSYRATLGPSLPLRISYRATLGPSLPLRISYRATQMFIKSKSYRAALAERGPVVESGEWSTDDRLAPFFSRRFKFFRANISILKKYSFGLFVPILPGSGCAAIQADLSGIGHFMGIFGYLGRKHYMYSINVRLSLAKLVCSRAL